MLQEQLSVLLSFLSTENDTTQKIDFGLLFDPSFHAIPRRVSSNLKHWTLAKNTTLQLLSVSFK